jgi:mRNA-degrading endonuclease toxin of MazEF toxin-antitoxin module
MSLADALHKIGIGKLRLVHGGIYRLRDELIHIPDSDAKGDRTKHDFRTVMVLSNDTICLSLSCPCVVVVPLSSKTNIGAETDIVIRKSGENRLQNDSRLMLGYTQPVLKSDFEKQIGRLEDEQWDTVMEQIVWNLDR